MVLMDLYFSGPSLPNRAEQPIIAPNVLSAMDTINTPTIKPTGDLGLSIMLRVVLDEQHLRLMRSALQLRLEMDGSWLFGGLLQNEHLGLLLLLRCLDDDLRKQHLLLRSLYEHDVVVLPDRSGNVGDVDALWLLRFLRSSVEVHVLAVGDLRRSVRPPGGRLRWFLVESAGLLRLNRSGPTLGLGVGPSLLDGVEGPTGAGGVVQTGRFWWRCRSGVW